MDKMHRAMTNEEQLFYDLEDFLQCLPNPVTVPDQPPGDDGGQGDDPRDPAILLRSGL